MAKYTVQHTCGHTQEHQLYGKHIERERKQAWLAGTDCSECYAAAQQQAAAAAKQQADCQGLPQLQGSDKQIAWALTIRESKLQEIADMRALVQANAATGPEIAERALQILDSIERQRSAAWWIENRDESVKMMIRAEMRK
jgi:hypothetical protein